MDRSNNLYPGPPYLLAASLAPDQPVTITTDSQIHRGRYDTTVLAVDRETIRVALPMDAGRVVLIPVGTTVGVHGSGPNGPFEFRTRVVDRRSGADRCLVLALPSAPHKAAAPEKLGKSTHVVAVASGKGGVGKTVLVVNLAVALAQMGKRVCIIDGDLGTANVDVLLNLTPKYHLAHVIAGTKSIFDVLLEAPHGIVVLPGGSGFQELTHLGESQFQRLMEQFRALEDYTDWILIDTGAGLSKTVTGFLLAAHDSIVITTPEPHAITDAYALIKVLASQGHQVPLYLVVNRTESEREADEIAEKMIFASRRFLGFDLKRLGFLVEDPVVRRAIRRQHDFVSHYPTAKATLCIQEIAARLNGHTLEVPKPTGIAAVLGRMKRAWTRSS